MLSVISWDCSQLTRYSWPKREHAILLCCLVLINRKRYVPTFPTISSIYLRVITIIAAPDYFLWHRFKSIAVILVDHKVLVSLITPHVFGINSSPLSIINNKTVLTRNCYLCSRWRTGIIIICFYWCDAMIIANTHSYIYDAHDFCINDSNAICQNTGYKFGIKLSQIDQNSHDYFHCRMWLEDMQIGVMKFPPFRCGQEVTDTLWDFFERNTSLNYHLFVLSAIRWSH